MPTPTKPVSIACCLTGTYDDRARTIHTLAAALRPGDHVFAIEGSCGPVAAPLPDPVPPGVNVVRIPAVFIGVAFDMVARSSHHDQMVFLGESASVTAQDVDAVRVALESTAPGAVALSPHRTTVSVALDARSVIGVTRQVVLDMGGMAYSTYKARGMSSGLIGSGDLFDAFLHEVRRSGWPVVHVPQTAPSIAGSAPVPTPPSLQSVPIEPLQSVQSTQPLQTDTSVPPSRRILPELRAAMGPKADAVVDWFAGLVSDDQRSALCALIGREARPSTAVTPDGWDLLFLVGMLWRSGQVPYAAHLLETGDLRGYVELAQVADIRQKLTDAGRPFAVVLQKLAHAQGSLAAALLQLPPEQAHAALTTWWELVPGAEVVVTAATMLLPHLGPAEAAAWELRLGHGAPHAART